MIEKQNQLDMEKYLVSVCPDCGNELTFDGIHLMCDNKQCVGRIAKQLSSSAELLKLRGIGPKTIAPFASDFEDMVDLIYWVRKNGDTNLIEKYGIKFNTKSHTNFLKAFTNIKAITMGEAIKLLAYNNVGLKLANLVAKLYTTDDADFSGHNKEIVSMFRTDDTRSTVIGKINKLKEVGIIIEEPKEVIITDDSLFVCMTGSPKKFGFATKKVFTAQFDDRINEVSLTSKDCKILITDNLNSTSSKMKTAKKKGIEILTYGEFTDIFK